MAICGQFDSQSAASIIFLSYQHLIQANLMLLYLKLPQEVVPHTPLPPCTHHVTSQSIFELSARKNIVMSCYVGKRSCQSKYLLWYLIVWLYLERETRFIQKTGYLGKIYLIPHLGKILYYPIQMVTYFSSRHYLLQTGQVN